jgi:hypothetical protein
MNLSLDFKKLAGNRLIHNKFIALCILFSLTVSCGGQPVASTSTPNSIPTMPAPTSTASPTMIPPTFTPTITTTPVPGGPCDNPLVPLVTGNEWFYLLSGGKEDHPYKWIVGQRQDIGNININVEMLDPKRTQDVTELVVCQDGAIDNFPLYILSMLLTDYTDGYLNTYKGSGQYVPAHSVFASNNWKYEWQSRYLVERAITINDSSTGSAIYLLLDSPIDVSFKTDGKYESTIVPGGSFPQALVVANDYTSEVTVRSGGIITSGTLVIKTTQLYVPYVGLVRAVVDSASVSIMPGQASGIPITSVLELIEFKPGK